MTDQMRHMMDIVDTLCEPADWDDLTDAMRKKCNYVNRQLKSAIIHCDPTIGSVHYIVYNTINSGALFGEYVVVWSIHGDCMAFVDVTADSLTALTRDVFKYL